mmetsp:Transcript_98866/g.262539  ORF Transcript_98866/g.262539 Transcript_98866/m.262539 type:complete len:226 (+) Transcript_98866:936-1613(+)
MMSRRRSWHRRCCTPPTCRMPAGGGPWPTLGRSGRRRSCTSRATRSEPSGCPCSPSTTARRRVSRLGNWASSTRSWPPLSPLRCDSSVHGKSLRPPWLQTPRSGRQKSTEASRRRWTLGRTRSAPCWRAPCRAGQRARAPVPPRRAPWARSHARSRVATTFARQWFRRRHSCARSEDGRKCELTGRAASWSYCTSCRRLPLQAARVQDREASPSCSGTPSKKSTS